MKKTILGIDPGTADTGFAVASVENKNITVLNFGVIKTKKTKSTEIRLLEVYDSIIRLINKYKPDIIVIEKLFFHANVKTGMKVGQSRGVILLAAAKKKLKVEEFAPTEVKALVTGYGRASKMQVKYMIKQFFNLKELPKPDDAADALALILCSVFHNKGQKK